MARPPSGTIRSPPALGRSRGGGTPTLHLVAADARTALAFSLSPGQAPAAPHGRQLLLRLEPQPGRLLLLTARASAGAEPRPLAGALG